jgi:hypothetical protein
LASRRPAIDAYGDVYISGNTSDNVVAPNIGGGLVETLTKDTSGFPFTSAGAMAIHGKDIYVGFGPQPGKNAVISFNVGEFLTGDPQEMTVYNDNVKRAPPK